MHCSNDACADGAGSWGLPTLWHPGLHWHAYTHVFSTFALLLRLTAAFSSLITSGGLSEHANATQTQRA